MRTVALAAAVTWVSYTTAQIQRVAYPPSAPTYGQQQTLQFCDNVEIEATQDGLKVELLLQPFGLVCVMADMLSGGRLGEYMEDGLVTWKLNTEEYLGGMGVQDWDMSFAEVPEFFASLAERATPRLESGNFGTAFTATVMGLGIDTPTTIVSDELASRLGELPTGSSQFDVLGAVMGMDVWDSPLDLENALVARFKNPEAASVEAAKNLLLHATGTIRDGVRGTEAAKKPELAVNALNMMSPTGKYNNPAGPFIFPDRAMTSMVGEGERRRKSHAQGAHSGSSRNVIVNQIENFMPF